MLGEVGSAYKLGMLGEVGRPPGTFFGSWPKVSTNVLDMITSKYKLVDSTLIFICHGHWPSTPTILEANSCPCILTDLYKEFNPTQDNGVATDSSVTVLADAKSSSSANNYPTFGRVPL